MRRGLEVRVSCKSLMDLSSLMSTQDLKSGEDGDETDIGKDEEIER